MPVDEKTPEEIEAEKIEAERLYKVWKDERKRLKKEIKKKFKSYKQDARIKDIVRDLVQHAPNHPDNEKGMIVDHMAKLEAIEDHRELNGFVRGKYADDIAELEQLLDDLNKGKI